MRSFVSHEIPCKKITPVLSSILLQSMIECFIVATSLKENMEQQIVSKLPNIGLNIFSKMSALAQQHQAVNLAQGFPDFSPSSELIELVHTYMLKGFNQYAPLAGVRPLVENLSHKVEMLYGATYNPDSEITITCGATEACYTALTSILHEGDEVIIPEPSFDVYLPAIELSKAKAVFVPLRFPDFSYDWELIRSKITARTKLIIINSPHNPTGSIITAEDVTQLQKIVEEFNLYVLSDEVYEHIVFDGKKHISISSNNVLKERSFVIGSFGKTYHVTGWRLGYCLAPKAMMVEFKKVHQYNTFSPVAPMQFAVADFMKKTSEYELLPTFFQNKRDVFLHHIKNSRWEVIPSTGTYFQLLSYKAISSENDIDFADRLTREFGLASIPVSVFYSDKTDHKMLRFCIAKKDETLLKAAEILCKI
jgi:methionine aminotransferase